MHKLVCQKKCLPAVGQIGVMCTPGNAMPRRILSCPASLAEERVHKDTHMHGQVCVSTVSSRRTYGKVKQRVKPHFTLCIARLESISTTMGGGATVGHERGRDDSAAACDGVSKLVEGGEQNGAVLAGDG